MGTLSGKLEQGGSFTDGERRDFDRINRRIKELKKQEEKGQDVRIRLTIIVSETGAQVPG